MNYYLRIVVLTIAYLLQQFVCVGNTSSDSLRFVTLGKDEGLNQLNVLSILQDKNGFMWFATQTGVSRFDGHGFKLYGKKDFEIQNVTKITEDRLAEKIWIGQDRMEGLTYVSTRDYRTSGSIKELIGHDITSVLVIGKDSLIVAANKKETSANKNEWTKKFVFFIDGDQVEHISSLDLNEKNNRENLLFQINEKVFMASGEELFLISLKNGKFEKKLIKPLMGEERNKRNIILVAGAENSDQIFVGLESKDMELWNVVGEGYKRVKSFPDTKGAKTIAKDSLGRHWIGTRLGVKVFMGLDKNSLLNEDKIVKPIEPLYAIPVESIYVSYEGVVWLGTIGKGIYYNSPREITFREILGDESTRKANIRTNFIWTLEEGTGNPSLLWVGTNNGLLRVNTSKQDHSDTKLRLAAESDEFKEYANEILDIEHLGDSLILATANGLYITDTLATTKYIAEFNAKFSIKPQKNGYPVINALLKDTIHQYLWLGSSAGVFRAKIMDDHSLDSIYSVPIRVKGNDKSLQRTVISLSQDAGGQVWVGTREGLFISDSIIEGKPPEFYLILDSLNISCFYYDAKEEKMWVGTGGGGYGLFKIDRITREKDANYTTTYGLSDDIVYAILEDDKNNLWISTNEGLSWFIKKNEVFIRFSKEHGIPTDEFNSGAFLKSRESDLLFGGVNGITKVLNSTLKDSFPPIDLKFALVVNSLKEDEQVFLPDAEIKMPHDAKDRPIQILSFDYRQLGLQAYYFTENKKENCSVEWSDYVEGGKTLMNSAGSYLSRTTYVGIGVTDCFGNSERKENFRTVIGFNPKKWIPAMAGAIILGLLLMFIIELNRRATLEKLNLQVILQKNRLKITQEYIADRNKLFELGEKLLTTITPEEVFKAVKEYIQATDWNAGLFGIDLLNPKFKFSNGRVEKVLESKFTFVNDHAVAPKVIDLNKELGDPAVQCFNQPEGKAYRPASKVFVALMAGEGEEPLGVMKIYNKNESDLYSKEQFDLFKTLATYTANALRKANEDMDKTLLELKMKRFKGKTYYHFVSQSISGIRDLIRKGDLSTAKDVSRNLGWLIREVMELPVVITVKKEIEFLKSYVEIQKKGRQKQVDVNWPDQEVMEKYGKMKIPSMVLQLLMENAISYGLNLQDRKDVKELADIQTVTHLHIDLRFETDGEFLNIVLEDDGIGLNNRKRIQTYEPVDKDSRALSITNERIELINKIMKSKLVILNGKYDGEAFPEMTKIAPVDRQDKYKDTILQGTYVNVLIPLIYDFELLEND